MRLKTLLGRRKRRIEAASVALAQAVVNSGNPYQPLGAYRGASQLRSDEAFESRWAMIEAVLRESRARNLCDLGCAEGMYVRRASALGLFAVGIDYSAHRIRYANAVAELEQNWAGGFMHLSIDKESLQSLPRFDVVLFMSVFHHIAVERGIESAKESLKSVSRVTRRKMIFDTGGPDEEATGKAQAMSFLSGDTDRNIVLLLEQCGFTDVRPIGSAQGFGAGTMRTVFVASPIAERL